jgi:hypothetical protein
MYYRTRSVRRGAIPYVGGSAGKLATAPLFFIHRFLGGVKIVGAEVTSVRLIVVRLRLDSLPLRVGGSQREK